MNKRVAHVWIILSFLGTVTSYAVSAEVGSPTTVDFLTQVRPILVHHCLRCHSQLAQESSLRLDSIGSMLKGGERGAAITPGDRGTSLLVQAVSGDGDLVMPPEGDRLTPEQIELLARWIDEGAVAPGPEEIARSHWAFRRPTRMAIPHTGSWARNPIDDSFAEVHRREGLRPLPEAGKQRLLRRVYLDLIGLPPTPVEIDRFVGDSTPDAYEKIVDQLLAGPRYGERWARHWMDIWRYSDWAGHNADIRNSQPHIWRWRDWIIESLNENKPYDRMIVEMLAGDEVAPDDPQTLRATGYLVRNWYNASRNVWLQDTTDHTAKGFLGLTIGCARCHDHMYDPITHEDYFRFRAFFEPHEIRTDPIGGEPDTKKDGLVRVYDAHHDAITVLFKNGDDRRPDPSRTFDPAPPLSLSDGVDIQPVALPVDAYYPGFSAAAQQAALEAARAALSAAEEALASARGTFSQVREKVISADMPVEARTGGADEPAEEPSAGPATVKPESQIAEQELRLAEAQHEVASRELATVIARVNADNARYSTPPADETAALIAAAVAAEAELAVPKAAAALRDAELTLAKAEAALPADAAAVENARQQVQATQTAYRESVERPKSPGLDYTPLGVKYVSTSTGRRLALARWIVNRDNPLTARVAVNHLWTRHFGRPLVERVDDFGLSSPPPRMQGLLDWLAVELMDRDWNMKALHRLIVTSSLYRMDSAESEQSEANRRIDRDNHHYWRWEPRRMEAELVRDAVLSVAGQLEGKLGGPELDQHTGQTTNRRSIYYRHAREKQMVFLKLFDAANMQECYRRAETTSPQQALALFNSPLAIRAARLLEKDLSARRDDAGQVSGASESDTFFVGAAYQQVLGRLPTTEERRNCLRFLQKQAELLGRPGGLTAFSGEAASAVGPADQPEQRARQNLVLVLLNLSEFVTIR